MPIDASETPAETSTQTRGEEARNTLQSASLRNDKAHAINNDDNPWKFPLNQVDDNCTNGNGDALIASLDEALSDDTSVQATLKTAACIQSLDKTLLQAALKRNDNAISNDLSAAEKVGIITFKGDSQDEYVFVNNSHTLPQLYNHIPVEDKSRQHVTIGRNLIQNLSQEQLQDYYYTVLRQFKLGEKSLTRQSERNAIATLCLSAGEYAVSNKGDFVAASLYLNFGISLLGRDSWKDEYDLTLALYNDAAEVEYSKSNYARVDELVETVLKNARSFNDTLRARASRIYCLSSRYQMTEAVDESLQVLHHLGEHFPANPKKRHIGRELMRTWRLLKGKTNESILRIPVMTDPNKLATLQILNLLFPGAYRTRPKLWGLIIIRIVRLTLLHGLSPVSAVGFAFYAAISSMITRDIAGSYRYAEVALALIDKFRAKEFIPRVYLGVYGHASSYKFFLRDMYPKFLHAHQVGLETGDTEFSCLAANLYCMYHVLTGDSLISMEKEALAFRETFELHQQYSASRMVLPTIQFAQNLMGMNDDPLRLVGDTIKDESILSDIVARGTESHDVISCAFLHFFEVVLAYVFNDYEAAAEKAKGLHRITLPPYLHPTMSTPYTFYTLALLSVCNDRRGRLRRRILSTARRSIKKLQQFSLLTPENCLGKTFLLQAELAVATGKNQEAKCHYVSAISVATRFDDWMMHAIACERAGRFALGCDDDAPLAARYFREAHAAYKEWGAVVKAQQLEKDMPIVLTNV